MELHWEIDITYGNAGGEAMKDSSYKSQAQWAAECETLRDTCITLTEEKDALVGKLKAVTDERDKLTNERALLIDAIAQYKIMERALEADLKAALKERDVMREAFEALEKEVEYDKVFSRIRINSLIHKALSKIRGERGENE